MSLLPSAQTSAQVRDLWCAFVTPRSIARSQLVDIQSAARPGIDYPSNWYARLYVRTLLAGSSLHSSAQLARSSSIVARIQIQTRWSFRVGNVGKRGITWGFSVKRARRIERRDSTQPCQHKQQQSRFNVRCLSFSVCVHNGLSLGRSREYRVGPEMFRLVILAWGFRHKALSSSSSARAHPARLFISS